MLDTSIPEQSQALALISEDVPTPECVQQAEVLAVEANRTFRLRQ